MSKESWQAPPQWRKGVLPYKSGLTLKTAKKMIAAGEKEAEKQGVPMVMAVADAGGNLLALHRMDNVMLASINIAIDKAYTSAMSKVPTWFWTTAMKKGEFAPLFVHNRFICFPGGFPLKKNGAIYGGIGVSGGIAEDNIVAKAMLEAGGFDVDEADATLKRMDCL